MYVNAKNFAIDRQNRSLSSKNVEPWKITKNIDNKAYELDIPEHLKSAELTPIFHPWKLHLAPFDPFPGQIVKLDAPILVIDIETTNPHEEYELLKVVNCRETRRFGIQYKATYIEPWDEWNTNPPWQPWTDFLNSKDAVLRFHADNPDKPKAPQEMTELEFIENDQIGISDETWPLRDITQSGDCD